RTLAVIVGGALYAIGVALLYQIDASSGGTTVPPLILKKYFNFKTSVSLLVLDTIVCLMNIFSSGMEAFILALFSSVITLLVMNYIETGIDRKKSVYIMSSRLSEVEEIISESLDQSYTSLNVQGGFSGDN
ncbi:YitT family protein, partial [Pediococcus acidilactici]|nr:YitT family protein [Pediococcus acidilactici]